MRTDEGYAALFVLALVGALACKREAPPKPGTSAVPSASPISTMEAFLKFKPSTEPEILDFVGTETPWAHKRVILEQTTGLEREGSYEREGYFVTDDGIVYEYSYRLSAGGPDAGTPCDVRKLEGGSPELYECLHARSQIVGRLEPLLLRSLLVDLTRVAESKRVEWKYITPAGGQTVLEVPSRGYRGGALEIAWCKVDGASQQSSPDATRIINAFRRIRRALGRGRGFVAFCPHYWEPRKEIAPGVRAWWAQDD
jgi:hypothetical protein